jgi:hypothetical protein
MIPDGLEVLSYRFSGGANLQGISKPATFSSPLFDSTEVILNAERKARYREARCFEFRLREIAKKQTTYGLIYRSL